MKVKTIESDNFQDLERQINVFIADKDEGNIYTCIHPADSAHPKRYSAVITY